LKIVLDSSLLHKRDEVGAQKLTCSLALRNIENRC
jgi:hypothetical protein